MRGQGRVYQRGSRWWIEYWHRGEQYREPAIVVDRRSGLERAAKTEEEAERKLRARRAEIAGDRFVGLQAERVTVPELLDALLTFLTNNGKRSVAKLRSHLKAVREFFSMCRAMDVTSKQIERYKEERLRGGKAPATVNRELEGLRQAFNHAAKQTPPVFPKHRVPYIPFLDVDNVREGFFERAEIEALLDQVLDVDLRDFMEWGFRTGQRKGEIAQLTWEMLDRSGPVWVLRLPGSIAKNKMGRSLGLAGETRAIMERRLARRRLDCPLIFHRVSKGRAGQPIKDVRCAWRNALQAAKLPPGRLFHDLRRSAVRTLIRSGVDPSVAMKVSGHKTRSMLDRYNIVEESETAAALAKADVYLSTQPTERNVTSLHTPAQNPHKARRSTA